MINTTPTTITITTPVAAWPSTVPTLRELLEIDTGRQLSCHTYLPKYERRCKRDISISNSALITRLLEQIIILGSFTAAQSLLAQVARLVMCQRNHKDEGSVRLLLWEGILKPLEAKVIKQEDQEDVFKPEEETVPTTPVAVVKPKSQLKDETSREEATTAKPTSRRRSQSSPSTPAKSSPRLRSSKETPPKNPEFKHKFENFSPPRNTTDKNKAIKELLLRPLAQKEKESEGYVYIYTFPETYRIARPYLKIGYAQNVEERMARWEAQCGYRPQVLSQFTADHYIKLEKLVHAQLFNQRKREISCPTCGVRHQEWFDIDLMTATMITTMWTTWMRRQPYDDEGNLQEKWRVRIEGLDLTDPDCWMLLVKGVFDDDADESELSEEGDSFAWSSDDQSELSEEEILELSDVESGFSDTDNEYDDKDLTDDEED
ncbi:hypothetical protein FSARC_432 [Fusarium sarcochroum]|uniref:Bacteriophage T5 Orf172 DNA-binding domain-containing protein n=1 Tax=Fusarium sarcochroum TaxID=1208366 RepID=A0A8H4UBW5_9HYPO|nr:hypothetical protein FSARC_432 [Fusarium sarcochroum]